MDTSEWELGRQVRYFNGTFRKLRLERGFTQEDVGNAIGASKSTVSHWETLRESPPKQYHEKLEKLFGMPITEMFPEFLEMLKPKQLNVEEYTSVSIASLEASNEGDFLLGDGDTMGSDLDKRAAETAVREALKTLSEREQKILKMRFGLDGGSRHTLEEVAAFFAVNRERIRQIEARALSKLRVSCKDLKKWIEVVNN